MDADKPVPVVDIIPTRYIGGPSKRGRTGNIQGSWDPHVSIPVVMTLGVPVVEALFDIVMNYRRAVISLECDCEEEPIKLLEKGFRNYIVNQ